MSWETVMPARSTASGCSALRIYDVPFPGPCLVIDIFDDQPIRMPETHLAADRGFLDRFQLLRALGQQHGHGLLERRHLDRQPGRFEWLPPLRRAGDDQDRQPR